MLPISALNRLLPQGGYNGSVINKRVNFFYINFLFLNQDLEVMLLL